MAYQKNNNPDPHPVENAPLPLNPIHVTPLISGLNNHWGGKCDISLLKEKKRELPNLEQKISRTSGNLRVCDKFLVKLFQYRIFSKLISTLILGAPL